MKLIKSKKGIVLLLATAVVAGLTAFGAYAYFTSSGSGSGSATVASAAANDLSITLTPSGTLYPGAAPIAATVNIANPESYAQGATSVSPDGSSAAAVAAGADPTTGASVDSAHASTCSGADFHFYGDGATKDSALSLNAGNPYDIAGTSNHDFSGAKVGMDDNGNQDGCESAQITFWLSSN